MADQRQFVYLTDDAAPANKRGNALLVQRLDVPATVEDASGDWTVLHTNSLGSLWVALDEVAGTDGATGPAKAVSIGGTEAGGNLQEILVDANGHLQVDVLTGGGSDTPTNPVNDYQTSASLAAGSSADLTTAAADDKKLAGVECWSSVAFKVAIHTVDNGVESTNPVAIGGGNAYQPFVWNPPHRNYVTVGNTAGLDAFRAKITNLDDSLAADIYATFHMED